MRHRRGGREVLRIDALDLAGGERLAVLGPNGAGKTTLLGSCSDRHPDRRDPCWWTASRRPGAVALRRRVAYATQRPGLLSTSVRRNVELPLRWRRVPRTSAACRRGRNTRAPGRRTAGRAAGGRALGRRGPAREPRPRARARARALLLDEPAAALTWSPAQRSSPSRAGARRAHDHRGPCSHRPAEAFRLADRVAVLVDGGSGSCRAGGADARPADARGTLVGYENLLEAEVDDRGAVRGGGTAHRPSFAAGAGPAIVAAWAAGVQLRPTGAAGIPATVEYVSPGPGPWEITLAAPMPLRAHLPLGAPLPRLGGAPHRCRLTCRARRDPDAVGPRDAGLSWCAR